MKFLYKFVPTGLGNKIALPLVDVVFEKLKLPATCLIDSGATYSFFHSSLAKLLGIDFEKGEKFSITGVAQSKFVAYLHKDVPVVISGVEFPLNVAFSSDLGTPYNLLGQHDFFEKFRICFDLQKNEFELTPKF